MRTMDEVQRGVAGYVYKAECFCPECMILEAGGSKALMTYRSAEAYLDEIGHRLGIDREDECSFDSDFFPKVIGDFSDEWDCSRCGDSYGC